MAALLEDAKTSGEDSPATGFGAIQAHPALTAGINYQTDLPRAESIAAGLQYC